MSTDDQHERRHAAQVELRGQKTSIMASFVRSGEIWMLGYGGASFSLKDSKGLAYINRLLQHPGAEFHSLDLVSGTANTQSVKVGMARSIEIEGTDRIADLGDAGELLDAEAKHEYRLRLRELFKDLEEERDRGNSQRVDEIEREIEFLNREIARAVGLGGRDRRAGSASERARLNVTRSIKLALHKIAEHHSAMSAFLTRSIRTGTFCSYLPDPRYGIVWQFSARNEATLGDIAAPVPLFSHRETTLLRSLSKRTAFVGRTDEREELRRSLNEATAGSGKIVLLSGAAGVGKTRIAEEFCTEASLRGVVVRTGNCYDRGDSVPFIPFVEVLEEALAKAPSPDAFRASLGRDASEIARLLPQLRRIFADIPPPLEVPAEQSRRLLFNAGVEYFARASIDQTVVLLLDDLQWADEGTSSLLSYLAPFVASLRVLIIGAYRDSELDRDRPFVKALDELTRLHLVEQMNLRGLSQPSVAEMLRALSGQGPPDNVVSLFYSDTEGNPFFVEELFHHLVEQGKLVDAAGRFFDKSMVDTTDLPRSVRVVIDRRLGRLSRDARRMLAAAASIGRSFTFELLSASLKTPPDPLVDQVEEAEKAGLIYSTLDYPETRFHFSHELIRKAVMSEISAARRERLHLGIAEAIEEVYLGEIESHASDLAYHLWQAGKSADVRKAINYLELAAKQAITRSATADSVEHLTREITLLEKLPVGAERHRHELFAQSALGTALQATRGFAAPEVSQAFARAHELAEKMGDTSQLVSVLRGQAFFSGVRADYREALSLGRQMLQLSEQKPEYLVEASVVMGLYSLYLGELTTSRSHLERGVNTELPQGVPLQAIQYAGHSRAMCLSYLARTLWLLGYPDQALRRSEEALTLAYELSLPATIALTQGMHALLFQARRDITRALEWSEKTIAYSREHGFSYWYTLCSIIKGWLLGQSGQSQTGIEQYRKGLDGYQATGAKLGLSWFLALLAELYYGVGKTNDGLRVMHHALSHIENTSERYYESEVYRLNGEILLKQSGGQSLQAAEDYFQKALVVARRQCAKAWELRSATSLARLWRNEGRFNDAARVLSSTFESFSEGFGTQDLQDARRLLVELDGFN